MPNTLAVDFGLRNVGIALVEHAPDVPNRVLYAATIVVDREPLKAAVQPRAMSRRMRRTRQTHKRRLRGLAQALNAVPGAAQIVRFCRRRGYSHESEDADESTRSLSFSRAEFFIALRREVEQVIPAQHQDRVLRACSKHLNESRRREAELRPARFENRGPSKCQWEIGRAHV
jgi:CRISPR/Cas system Type II protein with McrA/HNH and RuvC-like nuclease domain